MRPEFERGKGTGQWHGGPIAAIIDTVGDYALIMALRRGLPTINFRVDYLRPAIKTSADHHRHGAPQRQERRRRRCRRLQRQKALLAIGRATYSTLRPELAKDLTPAADVTSLSFAPGRQRRIGTVIAPAHFRRRRARVRSWLAPAPGRRSRRASRGAAARWSRPGAAASRRPATCRRAAARARPSPRPSCSSGWATARWTASSRASWPRAGSPPTDFKSYTVKLREGVKFHDGKPMTADDVVYSIDEIWKKYAAASAMTDYAGIEAPDAGTVVIKFGKPMPEFFFASLLCGNVNYIVPKHVYAGSDPSPIRPTTRRSPPARGSSRSGCAAATSSTSGTTTTGAGPPLHGPADHPLRARSGRTRRGDGGRRDPDRRVQSRGAARHQAPDRHRQVRRHAARATRRACGRPRWNATCAIRCSPSARCGRRCSTPSTAT